MEVQFKKIEVQEIKTKLDGVKNGGRQISFKAKGEAHEASISGSRTKVSIGGKGAKRANLKAGMTCTIKYGGDKSTAQSVSCN
jgi:hypothetical protein